MERILRKTYPYLVATLPTAQEREAFLLNCSEGLQRSYSWNRLVQEAERLFSSSTSNVSPSFEIRDFAEVLGILESGNIDESRMYSPDAKHALAVHFLRNSKNRELLELINSKGVYFSDAFKRFAEFSTVPHISRNRPGRSSFCWTPDSIAKLRKVVPESDNLSCDDAFLDYVRHRYGLDNHPELKTASDTVAYVERLHAAMASIHS